MLVLLTISIIKLQEAGIVDYYQTARCWYCWLLLNCKMLVLLTISIIKLWDAGIVDY